MSESARNTDYSVDDPAKIQGRDEVYLADRSLATLRLQRALDALGLESLTVLMPGAGAGRYVRALVRYRPGWQIVAGDLSPAAIAEAQSLDQEAVYQVFDAESIPFESGSFDAVVFFDLLEHVPNPAQLLRECWRVLRPGGLLHFFVPLEDQSGTLYRFNRNNMPIPIHSWKREHVGHIQRFQDIDVLRLTWDAGFRVEHVDYSFHLTGQIHDILDYWQRERSRGGPGRVPVPVVDLVTRLAFVATWRLAYLEDRVYSGSLLASGLHVTARR